MNKSYTNNSTVRTFAILEIMAKVGSPLSLTDISEATNLDVTTIRRFIMTLSDMGYVAKVDNGNYKMTSKILDLSSSYLRNISLPEQSLPFLTEFCKKTNASVSLGILDGSEAVYIAHVSEKEALSVGVRIGTRLPAHATAIGKVLLSKLSSSEIHQLYKENLPIFTTRTIPRLGILNGALSEVRNQGFAISDEEYEVGVRAASTPIQDANGQLISALNVSVKTEVISKQKFYTEIVPTLLDTAYKISNSLKSTEN